VHWTYCGESLSVNVTLNGSDSHEDAVYQAVLKVLQAGREDLLDPCYSVQVWPVSLRPFEDCWDNNEKHDGILFLAAL